VGSAVRATFVYANSRTALQDDVASGVAPDTGLLGENHLREAGIEAVAYEPLLQRWRPPTRLARVAWHLREVTLPWEVGRSGVLCAALGPLLPLSARARRGPKIVLFNMSLCTRLDRSNGARRRIVAAGVRSADAVVCFAEAQRERLIEQTGCDPGRVHTLLLGVDERFLTSSGPPPRDGHVLAVGRDLARDYRTLAAAVSGLDARVVLVASQRNLRGLPLPPNVDVRCDISPLELRAFYDEARCVVIPTRAEGYPYGADCSGQTVLVDAMAMGRPAIVSERSTLRGYVENGSTALVVPPEDPTALRDTLDALLADPLRGERIGAAGRVRVEAGLTTRVFAKRLAGLVNTFLTTEG
jgi:glycosyltransferase involved in cell wall biosynthesis